MINLFQVTVSNLILKETIMFNSLSNLVLYPFGLSTLPETMTPPSSDGDSITGEHMPTPYEEDSSWLNIEGVDVAPSTHSHESSSSSHTAEPIRPPMLTLDKPKLKEKTEEEQHEKKPKLGQRIDAALFWSQKPPSVKVPPQQQQNRGSGKFNTTMSHSRKALKV